MQVLKVQIFYTIAIETGRSKQMQHSGIFFLILFFFNIFYTIATETGRSRQMQHSGILAVVMCLRRCSSRARLISFLRQPTLLTP
jgi:hypothetical protein